MRLTERLTAWLPVKLTVRLTVALTVFRIGKLNVWPVVMLIDAYCVLIEAH